MKYFFLFKQLIAVLVFCSLGGNCFAAEVDSFTGRRELADSRYILNREVGLWLEQAIAAANRKTMFDYGDEEGVDFCSRERLFKALKEKFTGFIIGKLESKVSEDKRLDTIHVAFKDSIYRDFEFTESPTISLTGHLAVVLRVGDVYLGADKFGHFFTEGLSYYEKYSALDTFSALQFGELSESTFYGELTTGVFSYADLAANLNGLRFWNAILALKPDPISPETAPQPYVQCVDKKWALTRAFDWADYVDPAWDEAVNANAFRNEVLLEKVQRRIALAGHETRIPAGNVDRQVLEKKYGDLLPHIYNPDGNKVLAEALKPKFELYCAMIFKQWTTPQE